MFFFSFFLLSLPVYFGRFSPVPYSIKIKGQFLFALLVNNIIFLDDADKKINPQNSDSQLIMLNFWATWCEPCKEEMPSLNRLQVNKKVKNLKIYPINIGKENIDKVNSFFAELGIDNI